MWRRRQRRVGGRWHEGSMRASRSDIFLRRAGSAHRTGPAPVGHRSVTPALRLTLPYEQLRAGGRTLGQCGTPATGTVARISRPGPRPAFSRGGGRQRAGHWHGGRSSASQRGAASFGLALALLRSCAQPLGGCQQLLVAPALGLELELDIDIDIPSVPSLVASYLSLLGARCSIVIVLQPNQPRPR